MTKKTPVPVTNPSPKKESIKENIKEIYSPDDFEWQASLDLLERIQQINPNFKIQNMQTWCKDMAKLIKQRPPFANILLAAVFRQPIT